MKIEGKSVVDAKRPVYLSITESDIRKATPSDPHCCAAAQACMRQFHAKEAIVHMARIYVLQGRRWFRYQTPLSIRSEIIAYDRRASFCPGTYKLAILQPSKRANGKRQGSITTKAKKNGRSATRAKPHFIKNIRAHMANWKYD